MLCFDQNANKGDIRFCYQSGHNTLDMTHLSIYYKFRAFVSAIIKQNYNNKWKFRLK